MKLTHILAATLVGASLLLSSCVAGYGYGYSTGYATTGGWYEASYDENGFPIFGYYDGRPIYGYTAAGVAVFSIAALTALCYVPHWGPAPWYRGHWHYPRHIHRVAAPPHFPHGHMPHIRPHGGHGPHGFSVPPRGGAPRGAFSVSPRGGAPRGAFSVPSRGGAPRGIAPRGGMGGPRGFHR